MDLSAIEHIEGLHMFIQCQMKRTNGVLSYQFPSWGIVSERHGSSYSKRDNPVAVQRVILL
jgi:hypothetical protein